MYISSQKMEEIMLDDEFLSGETNNIDDDKFLFDVTVFPENMDITIHICKAAGKFPIDWIVKLATTQFESQIRELLSTYLYPSLVPS